MTDIAELIAEHTSKIEGKLNEQEASTQQVKCHLQELEQKMARTGGGGYDAPQGDNWGRDFVRSCEDALTEVKARPGAVSMAVKTTITSGDASSLIVPARDQVLGMPRRRLTIRNLLNVVPVTSGSVEYPRQLTGANGADVVAEGALKPESGITWDMVTAPIRTIAHWLPASVQVLEDAPMLQSMIDEELRYGVALKEESELLHGSGTGQHLNGMVTQATAFDDPMDLPTPNMIDKIGAAILQCALTEVSPDGVVVHPADWWRMRLLKNAQGEYILGDPGANVVPTLFGLPVVPTTAQTVDKFLVGAFKAQTLYDRHEVRIEISNSHADFFTRNLIAIRGEERLGFAAKRPEALIYGDFGNVA